MSAAQKTATPAPQSVEALADRGRSFEMLGRLDLAARDHTTAPAQGGADPDLSHHLGLVHLRMGKLPDAEPQFLAANQGKPRFASLWKLGQLFEREGRIENAMTAYAALSRFVSSETPQAKERLRALRPRTADAGR